MISYNVIINYYWHLAHLNRALMQPYTSDTARTCTRAASIPAMMKRASRSEALEKNVLTLHINIFWPWPAFP